MRCMTMKQNNMPTGLCLFFCDLIILIDLCWTTNDLKWTLDNLMPRFFWIFFSDVNTWTVTVSRYVSCSILILDGWLEVLLQRDEHWQFWHFFLRVWHMTENITGRILSIYPHWRERLWHLTYLVMPGCCFDNEWQKYGMRGFIVRDTAGVSHIYNFAFTRCFNNCKKNVVFKPSYIIWHMSLENEICIFSFQMLWHDPDLWTLLFWNHRMSYANRVQWQQRVSGKMWRKNCHILSASGNAKTHKPLALSLNCLKWNLVVQPKSVWYIPKWNVCVQIIGRPNQTLWRRFNESILKKHILMQF